MSTKKQKFVYIFALVLSFVLGMLTMTGCAYFSQEKVAGTVSTVLEIAYVAGGAARVEQRSDKMGTDGKITEEQAVQLKLAAQKSYEELRLAYIADHISEQPEVRIKYFVPDEHKSGGAIIEFSGKVKKYLPQTKPSLWQMVAKYDYQALQI